MTICAADCATTSLAARALRRSTSLCDFGDAILFCDTPPAEDAGFRCIQIPRLSSRADYSKFILKDLRRFVRTSYVLVVQWDGYVLEPRAWTPEFLAYDMIGARWPWHKDGMTVGNGGFSLRSVRLLELTSAPDFPLHPQINEDEQICRVERPRLIRDFGVRFAPESLADRFSYERALPERPTFGFHGLFNLWRHVEDRELIALAGEFPPHIVRSREFLELLFQQLSLRKFVLVDALYSHLRRIFAPEEIRGHLLQLTGNPAVADRMQQQLLASVAAVAS